MAAIDRLTSAAEALRKTEAEGQSGTLAQMVSPCLHHAVCTAFILSLVLVSHRRH